MIQNTAVRIFRKFIGKFLIPEIQFRYSQFGEDIILAHLFAHLGIDKPSYLDIGANEPRFISNTYYFYEHGSVGVLIEPNPYLFEKLKKNRPKDIVINTGIGFSEINEADFYLFPNFANGLSTFSKEDALYWQEVGMKGSEKIPIEKTIKMKLTPVNSILEKYFSHKKLNLVSIDVEGLDLEILKSLDFVKYKPDVFCIETLKYDQQQNGYKNIEIIDFMLEKNYMIYGDTRVNTIFCNKELIPR